jgi:hypothetical protein
LSERPGIEITALLCDAAQEVGGKLYMLGAGWSRVIATGPLSMTLAIRLGIPWHAANQLIDFRIELKDSDRKPVVTDGQPAAKIEGRMEVGRPPGLRQGTVLDSSFVVPIQGLELQPGVYQWDLSFKDADQQESIRSLPFEVLPAK